MQEIDICRGRRIDRPDEWVTGYYFTTPLTDENSGAQQSDGMFFLTGPKRHCIANEDGCVFVIDPVSKSRFTGLYDKDGKKIYQGMKVLCFNVGPHDVVFKNGAWGYRPYMSDLNWFISFAGNSNFKWENSQSKHIAIIED